MDVTSVSNTNSALNFKQNLLSTQPKKEVIKQTEQVPTGEKTYTNKQLYTAVLASVIGSAGVVYGITHGKGAKLAQKLENELKNVSELQGRNSQLIKEREALTIQNQELKANLQSVIESTHTPEENEIYNAIREKIKNAKSDYDMITPPITGKKDSTSIAGGLKYPNIHTPTTIRSHIQEQRIPEITKDGRFDYEIPGGADIKVSRTAAKDFEPMQKTSTSISEGYADSVQWDNNKIARDVMQNFYDGHGQTLDGVRLMFEPLTNGKYKVRIEGKSTYDPDKAVFIGESTKRNDPNAAGNYGEGIKMASLKLLKDKGAENVKIGSNNWQVNYSLERSNLSDRRVLTYSMEKTPEYNGNYLEFETDDKELLETFRKTIGRFYSSSNKHFKCPDFENGAFGFKNLGKGEKGGLYISGQRFEFNGSYDGLNEIALFIKQKPPVKVLDPSRDRTSINDSQLEEIARWLSENCTTAEEKVQVIKALEKYGEKTEQKTPMQKFLLKFVRSSKWADNPLKSVQFPDNYVAYSNCSRDIMIDLKMAGYKIFEEDFNQIGMRTISNVVGDARKHNPIQPNEVEEKKILIIKEAIKRLSPALEGKHFSAEELDTKIFMFDKQARNESYMYRDTCAEAITDNGISKGFWIDKEYLNESKFAEALETALHELSHKAGGDGTSQFGYKLTNVNQEVIKEILRNPEVKSELSVLGRLWDELEQGAL